MPDPLTKSGEIIDIGPPEGPLGPSQAATVVNTDDLEVVRLVVAPGKDVPTHEFQGEIIALCLCGRVAIKALGKSLELKAGQLLQYSANEPFSVQATEEALLLVMVARRKAGGSVELLG
jgi:quercetin dioxygenase-like cupin family protein